MAHVLKGSRSFTCTRWRNEPYLPLPSQPKLVLIYRPRRDGRLSWPWVAGWLNTKINARHREFNPNTVTRLSTNRARRWLTSLIEANALTTMPDHQPQGRTRNSISYVQCLKCKFGVQGTLRALVITRPPSHYNLIRNVYTAWHNVCTVVPATQRSSLGDRTFPVALARAENALPTSARTSEWYIAFRRHVRTLLFKASFNNDRTWLRQLLLLLWLQTCDIAVCTVRCPCSIFMIVSLQSVHV